MKRNQGDWRQRRQAETDQRERISFRKESKRYGMGTSSPDGRSERTYAGRRRPSVQAGYSREVWGIPVEQAYGERYGEGGRVTPRRKLTLGNMVMRKQRKRVRSVTIRTGVGKNKRVSGQRNRQRIRGCWDKRNLQRRKQQRTYRIGRQEGLGTGANHPWKAERTGRIQARDRYLVVRECEVNRNEYERRSRYQGGERGPVRRQTWLSDKYEGKAERWNRRRKDRSQEEEGSLHHLHQQRRRESQGQFREKREERRRWCGKHPGRSQLEHVNTLRNRSEETLTQAGKGRHRERLGEVPFTDRREEEERQRRFAVPTTQYFAKRKNLIRRIEREQRQGHPDRSRRRKLPETERRERKPRWADRERWMNRRRKDVEKALRMGSRRAGEAERRYRELGKTTLYLYAVQRSQRWRDRGCWNTEIEEHVNEELKRIFDSEKPGEKEDFTK